MDSFFQWIFDTPLGTAIRENGLLFPWIESVHVLAITLVMGSIAVVDLRMLGVASRRRSISQLSAEVLPITWIAFVIAAITGLLLFTSNAVKYSHNGFFLWKMFLMVLAGSNMLVFNLITSRGIEAWDESPKTPNTVRLAGALSLSLWIAIIVCGRWIGFTMSAF